MNMNFLKKNFFGIVLMAFLITIPIISFAQQNPPSSGRLTNPINADTVQAFIQKLLIGVIKIGMPIVALAIIYCGFLFVSAQGKEEKLTEAKNALLYTLIGAAILLGSWAIATMISDTVLSL